MFFRSLARASTLFSAFVGALLAVLRPPRRTPARRCITGHARHGADSEHQRSADRHQPARARRHRRRGPLLDRSPLRCRSSCNGQPTGGLIADPVPEQRPGTRLHHHPNNRTSRSTPGQTFTLQLTVTNLAARPASVPCTVPITNTPGSVVDTTPEQAACDDPQHAAGRRTRARTRPSTTWTAQAGENVTLDASGIERSRSGQHDSPITWFDGSTSDAVARTDEHDPDC